MRNLKRALSLALASVMLMGMMVVGTSASFADVTADHNEEAIAVAQAAGIMIGDDAGNFNPDQKVTRNEAAVVLANLMGYKVSDFAGTAPFTDVPAWAEAYVSACYANGIVAGTSATTYGGNESVTAAQFALMVMKTLGYFQYAGDFADDWKLASVKQASKIELLDGVDASADTALTRNDVAEVVLTALESDVVDFAGKLGTSITTSDGTNIEIGFESKYEAIKSNTYSYADTNDGVQQLAEKLFKNKLQKNTTGIVDDFGRPAVEWTFQNESVGKYAKEADLTYTKAVESGDLYADLGLTTTNAAKGQDIVVYKNGTTTKTTFDAVKDDETTLGQNGTKLEVFVTKKTADGTIDSIEITWIDTVLGEITYVGKNSDDERIVRVDGMDYETESFAKKDLVLYTAADGEIKSMAAVEKLTGEVTKKVGADWYIDGTKYSVNAYNKSEVDTGVKVGTDIEFYVDSYGYIVKLDATDDTVSVDNLALLLEAGSDRGTPWAALRLSDGTKKVVDTDKVYAATEADSSMKNFLVSYKETDDGVELEAVSKYALAAMSAAYADDAVKMATTNETFALNDKVVFLYQMVDANGDSTYATYTGYKAAPAVTAADIAAYINDDGDVVFVYVKADEADLDIELADLTLVAYDKDVKWTEATDTIAYYEYNAVVDGELTTIKVDADGWDDLTSANAYGFIAKSVSMDKNDVVYAMTDAGMIETATIKYSAGVVTVDADSYACVDDVAVYIVSDEAVITIGELADIQQDKGTDPDYNPYAFIMYVMDKDNVKIDTIVVFEA